MAFELPRIERADWQSVALLQAVIDAIPDPIFVKDREHRWIVVNDAFCALLGRTREQILGRSDPDLFPPEQVEVFWRMDDAVIEGRAAIDNEELVTRASGEVRTIWTRKIPLLNARGEAVGVCGLITDISEQVERRDREQREIIAAQNAMLDALVTPIVEIWEGVLLMSLIGELSALRAEQAMQSLLTAASRHRAHAVLLDVTGLPTVDATVAVALQRTVRAAGLLGCETVLCGIGPEAARSLVMLQIDLGGVATFSAVRAGLAHVLRRRGLQ